tara:strand:+ start:772 stop:1749 length:978 start_codon:yes stop_codon:yes gene_type:complete
MSETNKARLKILISGGSGFLGSKVLSELEEQCEYDVYEITRSKKMCKGSHSYNIRSFNSDTDYSSIIKNKDVVIHMAARAHITMEDVPESLVEYQEVNVEGSKNLALQASAAGVKRFIYLSSIKVLGETTTSQSPFTESSMVSPVGAYACSKLQAEDVLRDISAETGMELVIIRPPLVYGPGVKANFRSIIKLSETYFPLPFSSVCNKRSMIYLSNLVDFIIRCIHHPVAANQTFLVSDGQDVSLKELITELRSAMGRKPGLIPMPVSLFRFLGKLTGKADFIDRLVGDLQVDSSRARRLLGWAPPYTFEQGIKETVDDYIKRKK